MPQTLLLADDSVAIQRVIELTFADEDIAVVAVGNGDHAIACIGLSPPDIVLADVGMPGRSGYEIARHIKATPALAHIPVLLLTGAFEPIDQARAAEVGCAGVLAKPFEPHVVIQRVKELLGARKPAFVWLADTEPPSLLAPAVSPVAAARLDDYFERLDQAFAARTADTASASKSPDFPPEDTDSSPLRGEPMPESPADQATPETPADEAASEAPAESPGPALAGAFSALLEAEQSGSEAEAFADWLSDEPEPASAAAIVSDDVIEAVVRRVLDRLSDAVVRDTVTAIASATAERLVREEIERIKSNIK